MTFYCFLVNLYSDERKEGQELNCLNVLDAQFYGKPGNPNTVMQNITEWASEMKLSKKCYKKNDWIEKKKDTTSRVAQRAKYSLFDTPHSDFLRVIGILANIFFSVFASMSII